MAGMLAAMKRAAVIVALGMNACAIGQASQVQTPAATLKPRVLLLGQVETQKTKQTSGVGAAGNNVALGSVRTTESTNEHSELWETARRFLQDCPAVSVTTDPSTPYDYAVRLDYEKMPMNLFGIQALYQLTVLNPQQEPLYVHRKDYLYREVKPACKAIMKNWQSAQAQQQSALAPH